MLPRIVWLLVLKGSRGEQYREARFNVWSTGCPSRLYSLLPFEPLVSFLAPTLCPAPGRGRGSGSASDRPAALCSWACGLGASLCSESSMCQRIFFFSNEGSEMRQQTAPWSVFLCFCLLAAILHVWRGNGSSRQWQIYEFWLFVKFPN
jgi:hypothetical protein